MAHLDPATGELVACGTHHTTDAEYSLALRQIITHNKQITINQLSLKIERSQEWILDHLDENIKAEFLSRVENKDGPS